MNSITISTGRGLTNPQAKRMEVTIAELPTRIRAHKGNGAWWAPFLWRGDHRDTDNFEKAFAFVADVDHYDSAGEHVAMPDEVWARAQAALAGVPHHLAHRSPRGFRLVAILDEPIEKAATFKRAAQAWTRSIAAAMETAGFGDSLRIDSASHDPARLFFTPTATVKSVARDAEVLTVDRPPLRTLDLLASAVEEQERPQSPPAWTGDRGLYFRRMRSWLDEANPSIEKQNGSGALMRALGKICAGSRLSPDEEWDLACHFNETKAVPPWSESELRHALDNARKDRRGTPLEDRQRPSKATNGHAAAGTHAAPESAPDNATSDEWPDPIVTTGPPPPPFPTHCLPPALARFVRETARDLQLPEDVVALLVLAAIAVCCARRIEVQVKPGFVEPVNLWAVVVADVGMRKSAAEKRVAAPLREYEREETERVGPQIAAQRSDREAMEERRRELVRKAAKAKSDEERDRMRSDAADLARTLASTPEPSAPRLLADDVTTERLLKLMAANGDRIGILSAEGNLFGAMAGRYSADAFIEPYLKAHSADPIRVDRQTGGALFMMEPALTLGLAVQPHVLQELNQRRDFKGKGLLGRFLYAYPTSPVGTRDMDPRPAASDAITDYHACIRALLRLEPGHDGAPRRLRFSPSAWDRFLAFSRELEGRRGKHGDMHAIADWAAKLEGQTARLAGLLHAAAGGHMDDTIGDDTVCRAIEIAQYLIPHTKAAYAEMALDPGRQRERRVLDWLRSKALREVSIRETHAALSHLFEHAERPADEVKATLARLEEKGWLRPIELPEEPGKRGRKPSPRFQVHPSLWSKPAPAADLPVEEVL